MRKIDLDLLAAEPSSVRFKAQVFEVVRRDEATVEQVLRHARFIDELKKAEKDYVDNKDDSKADQLLSRYRELSNDFDYNVIKVFAPKITQDTYLAMNMKQKDALLKFIFSDDEGTPKNPDPPSQDSERLGEKS